MPSGKYKSGSLRKVTVKTPGGKHNTHYSRHKPTAATCPVTGEKLQGVPRGRPAQIRKLSKTQKRPERPYGGVLSSRAMRAVIRKQARELSE